MALSGSQASPFERFIEAVIRRRWLSLGVAAVVAVLVVVVTFKTQPLYESRAILVVEREQQAYDNERPLVVNTEQELNLVNTMRAVLLSQPVLEGVLATDKLGEELPYAASDDPVGLLRTRLKAITSREDYTVQLVLRDESPQRADKILSAVIASFTAQEARRHAEKSQGNLSFLRDQVDQARAALEAARTREQSLRREKGILSTDPEANHLNRELANLNPRRVQLAADKSSMDTTKSAIDAAERAESAEARLNKLLGIEEIRNDDLVKSTMLLVSELRERREGLTRTLKERHPQMQAVTSQLATAEARLTNVVETARNARLQQHANLNRQLTEIDARTASLERQLGEYRDSLVALKVREQETATAEKLFQDLLQRLNQEQVKAQLDKSSSVTIAEPPHAGTRPVNVRPSLFLLGALISGAIAGMLAAVVAELLDRRIRDPDMIREFTDLPTLGQVPKVDNLPWLGRSDQERPTDKRLRAVDEAFRLLRSSLQLSTNLGKGLRTIAVLSPASGEGRTTFTSRLAQSLAASGRRVLLIDGDMRRPALHNHLGEADEQPGLSELLSGEGGPAVPIVTSWPRLDLLTGGTPSDDAAELLHGQEFKTELTRLAREYDCVLIDTPPMEFSEAIDIAAIADGIILLIRDRFTSTTALKLAHERLGRLQDKVIGLVVNADHVKAATISKRLEEGQPMFTEVFRRGGAEVVEGVEPR